MIYRFGDYEIDTDRFEVRQAGRLLELQPKVLELLLHLLRNRERVVGRDELLATLWPNTAVTDASVMRAVSKARALLGDRAEAPATIVTVARRGYRFAAPVEECSGQRASPPAPVEEPPSRRYIGRAALLERLEARLDAALAGFGCILFLAGEAGIGKTRTAELLAERARRAGALVASAGGPEEDAAPQGLWVRLLRALAPRSHARIAALPPAQRGALAQLAPELAGDRPGTVRPRPVPLGDEIERFAAFAALEALLRGLAAESPLVLLLDDLHRAETDSIVLLELLGETLARERIAIVVTCREGEPPSTPRQARALERLLRLTALERWALGGLAPSEVREFVRARTGGADDAGLCEALERQTGGNPLLMGEGLRSLEARGLLDASRDARDWEALLPRGVRHLLLPKLRSIGPAASELLAVAAAMGGELSLPLLERACEDPAACRGALVELLDAGLLVPGATAAQGLRFSHGLVRDALYEELVPAGEARRRLHARICRAFEAEAHGADDLLVERAHHALAAAPLAPVAEAVELARRAGRAARARLDLERALSWSERALAVLGPAAADPGGLRIRAELLVALGEAQARILGVEPARESFREAADYARTLGRYDVLAEAALGFAHRPSSVGSGDAETIRLLEEAWRQVPATEEALRVRLCSRLAVELRYDDRPRAEQLVAESTLAAERIGDAATLAQVLDDSSFVRWSPADPEGWLALNQRVVEEGQACGNLEMALSGQRGVVTARLELGDRLGVEREERGAARFADALHTPYGRWYCTANRAALALLDGDLAGAERAVGEALAHADRLESREVALEAGGQLVYLRLEQGRAHEVVAAVRLQLERFPSVTVWRAALARLLAASDSLTEARVELDRLAQRRFADVPRDRSYLPTLALAAGAALMTGEANVAAALAPLLLPFVRLHAIAGSGTVYCGSVAHALGAAMATRGLWDSAVSHYEAAIAAEESLGAQLWVARSRIECAGALLARAATGDRARAAKLVGDVLPAAQAAGWDDVVRAGRALEAKLWHGRSGRHAPTHRPRASER